MAKKPFTHDRWLKGLQAGFDRMAQPKGSVSRASNIVWTRRGAIKVSDGSELITNSASGLQSSFGPITEVFLYQPTGANVGYYGIVKDTSTHLAVPSGVTAAVAGSGLLNGTYHYVVTALDGAGGETTASSEASITVSSQSVTVSWTPVPNATGYKIYRTAAGGASGSEKLLATAVGQATSSITDNNNNDSSLGPGVPPSVNTTQVCEFYNFNVPSYSAANIIYTFPADLLAYPGGGTGGGHGGSGSGGGGSSGFGGPQPAGGITGNLSAIPMILQFVNKMMLALGNGYPPFISDGTTAGTVAITNTFTAVYPAWVASTVYNQGDQIEATVSGTAYVFTATQGGTSGTAAPAFTAVTGSTVTDHTIIWKNSGQVSGSPAPRGAAHEEIYAGSLWFANTSPTETSDELDGPSALRMSDLNNPTSWNPLNAAQISPDDADQCSGLKAFTVAEAGIAPQNFLMFFKYFSTYLIQGVFGASNFAITRLQTDLGCIAPRSIQFLPGYGIMRLTHLGFAVTDGITDKLENPEAIRPYLFPESTESDIAPLDQSFVYFSKGAQTAEPPMYVCACPLIPTILNLNIGWSVAFQAGSLPAGNYWFILQYFGPGVVYEAAEVGPVTIATGTTGGFKVTIPAFATALPGIAFARIYFGTSPGGESEYVQFTPIFSPSVGQSVNITSPGLAGTPVLTSQGELTRIFCYDLVLKSWTVVDVPFPISVLKQFRTIGSNPITLMAGFFDSGLRRWQAGDPQWDQGALNAGSTTLAVKWNFIDAEVHTEGATVRIFHNQVILRGADGPPFIRGTPFLNGQPSTTVQASMIPLGNGQFEARIRILRAVENLALQIFGTGPAVIESIDYNVVPKPAGAALIYS